MWPLWRVIQPQRDRDPWVENLCAVTLLLAFQLEQCYLTGLKAALRTSLTLRAGTLKNSLSLVCVTRTVCTLTPNSWLCLIYEMFGDWNPKTGSIWIFSSLIIVTIISICFVSTVFIPNSFQKHASGSRAILTIFNHHLSIFHRASHRTTRKETEGKKKKTKSPVCNAQSVPHTADQGTLVCGATL